MQLNRRVFASAIAASGNSKAPGTGITVTESRVDTACVELREGRLEQRRRDVPVEARDDDADASALTLRLALEHGVPGRNRELAGRMLQ